MRKDNELLSSVKELEKMLVKSKRVSYGFIAVIAFTVIVMLSACSHEIKSAYAINEYRALFDEFES